MFFGDAERRAFEEWAFGAPLFVYYYPLISDLWQHADTNPIPKDEAKWGPFLRDTVWAWRRGNFEGTLAYPNWGLCDTCGESCKQENLFLNAQATNSTHFYSCCDDCVITPPAIYFTTLDFSEREVDARLG